MTSSLPFILLDAPSVEAEPADLLPVLARLDRLQEIAIGTQREMDLLRQESAAILRNLDLVARTLNKTHQPDRPGVAEPKPQGVRVHLLGVFEARYNGDVLSRWASRKSRLLFAYLALEPGRMVARDLLIELLWPDASPVRGSNNLSIAVHQVRSALREFLPAGKQGIVVQQGLYGLDDSIWVDVSEFQAQMAMARPALQRGDAAQVRRHLVAAVNLYRGDILEDEPYEEWTEEPRRSLSMVHARALAWLAQDAASNQDWLQVLDYAELMLKRDACDEAAHRWVMTAHWRLGDRTRALQQYDVCCQRLQAALGAGPASQTTELYARVRRG